ncbi:hypothetical protein HWV62_30759 [Athelia sp. TMB]|nr:hypothetical protein HWV62_30759 [Athelia sp. TMB]
MTRFRQSCLCELAIPGPAKDAGASLVQHNLLLTTTTTPVSAKPPSSNITHISKAFLTQKFTPAAMRKLLQLTPMRIYSKRSHNTSPRPSTTFLPPEIWYKIASYACTDGGATGLSLSRVSKLIRASTVALKLQSVSIHGHGQVIAFHKLLLRTPSSLRRTRFLYISFGPTSVVVGIHTPDRMMSPVEIDHQEIQQASDACGGILEEVSESLEILYLNVPVAHFRPLSVDSFPKLVEMTSDGLAGLAESFETGDEPHRPPCPRLRRWHLMCESGTHPTTLLIYLHNIAPAITHLRFSRIQQEMANNNHHFLAALGVPADWLDDGWDLPTRELPSSVRLYLKPFEKANWIYTHPSESYDGIANNSCMAALRHLNDVDSRMVLLKAYTNTEEIWVRYGICTARQWEKRVNGSDECWSVSDRVPPKDFHPR